MLYKPGVSVIGGAGGEGPAPHVEGEHAAPLVSRAVIAVSLPAGAWVADGVLGGRGDRGVHTQTGLLRPQGSRQPQAETPRTEHEQQQGEQHCEAREIEEFE